MSLQPEAFDLELPRAEEYDESVARQQDAAAIVSSEGDLQKEIVAEWTATIRSRYVGKTILASGQCVVVEHLPGTSSIDLKSGQWKGWLGLGDPVYLYHDDELFEKIESATMTIVDVDNVSPEIVQGGQYAGSLAILVQDEEGQYYRSHLNPDNSFDPRYSGLRIIEFLDSAPVE